MGPKWAILPYNWPILAYNWPKSRVLHPLQGGKTHYRGPRTHSSSGTREQVSDPYTGANSVIKYEMICPDQVGALTPWGQILQSNGAGDWFAKRCEASKANPPALTIKKVDGPKEWALAHVIIVGAECTHIKGKARLYRSPWLLYKKDVLWNNGR